MIGQQLALLLDIASGDSTELAPGAWLLRGFAQPVGTALVAALRRVADEAPLRHMSTPGGRRMSVRMTSCGEWGWVSDDAGYRYQRTCPETGACWPAMPPCFETLAVAAASVAGFGDFEPDSCLINQYVLGARMTLHQDKNETDLSAPIVSVSLGQDATFLFGGDSRKIRPTRVLLTHGDVVVWGGPSRLNFHGVARIAPGMHPATGSCRYNLTFRRAR